MYISAIKIENKVDYQDYHLYYFSSKINQPNCYWFIVSSGKNTYGDDGFSKVENIAWVVEYSSTDSAVSKIQKAYWWDHIDYGIAESVRDF